MTEMIRCARYLPDNSVTAKPASEPAKKTRIVKAPYPDHASGNATVQSATQAIEAKIPVASDANAIRAITSIPYLPSHLSVWCEALIFEYRPTLSGPEFRPEIRYHSNFGVCPETNPALAPAVQVHIGTRRPGEVSKLTRARAPVNIRDQCRANLEASALSLSAT